MHKRIYIPKKYQKNPGRGRRGLSRPSRGMVRGNPATTSYIPVVEGGKPSKITSARFARKADALKRAKLIAKQQRFFHGGNIRAYVLHVNKPPEIGPGPGFALLNPGSTKALATAYAAKGGRIVK